MTTGNFLYLAMIMGVFVLFAGVLAFYSWQQSRLGPDMIPAQAEPEPDAEQEPERRLAA